LVVAPAPVKAIALQQDGVAQPVSGQIWQSACEVLQRGNPTQSIPAGYGLKSPSS